MSYVNKQNYYFNWTVRKLCWTIFNQQKCMVKFVAAFVLVIFVILQQTNKKTLKFLEWKFNGFWHRWNYCFNYYSWYVCMILSQIVYSVGNILTLCSLRNWRSEQNNIHGVSCWMRKCVNKFIRIQSQLLPGMSPKINNILI